MVVGDHRALVELGVADLAGQLAPGAVAEAGELRAEEQQQAQPLVVGDDLVERRLDAVVKSSMVNWPVALMPTTPAPRSSIVWITGAW